MVTAEEYEGFVHRLHGDIEEHLATLHTEDQRRTFLKLWARLRAADARLSADLGIVRPMDGDDKPPPNDPH